MMDTKAIKMHIFCALIVMILSCNLLHAADCIYWEDFEKRNIPIIQHIVDLSNDDFCYRNNECLPFDYRKNALSYFLSTGGKYGFRKEAPTEDEYNIIVKAVFSLTNLHYIKENNNNVLDLVNVRRSYGIYEENEDEKNHLIVSHSIIGYTLILHKLHKFMGSFSFLDIDSSEYDNITITKDMFNDFNDIAYNTYGLPLTKIQNPPSEKELRSFFGESLGFNVFNVIITNFSPKDGFSLTLRGISCVQKILRGFCEDRINKSIIKRITLVDDSYVERIDKELIFTNVLGWEIVSNEIFENGLHINAYFSDEELLNALHGFNIARILYDDGSEENILSPLRIKLNNDY